MSTHNLSIIHGTTHGNESEGHPNRKAVLHRQPPLLTWTLMILAICLAIFLAYEAKSALQGIVHKLISGVEVSHV